MSPRRKAATPPADAPAPPPGPETASLKGGLTHGTTIHPYDATGKKRNARATAQAYGNNAAHGRQMVAQMVEDSARRRARQADASPPDASPALPEAGGPYTKAAGQSASLDGGLTWSTTTDPYRARPEGMHARPPHGPSVTQNPDGTLAYAPTNNGDGTQSGTSIFDPVLCELIYRWWCPPGGAVLDPFAGGSVRGLVASVLGRRYTGIDLSPAQLAANVDQAARITPDAPPRWLLGDALDVATLAGPGPYDLLVSCPPYGDLEVYSDDPRDLSTMPYAAFLATYRRIVAASLSLLAEHRFAVFVVGDFRGPQGYYRNFVSDTIAAFQDHGARLYNDAILVTSVGSLPIRVGKQFESSRKLGRTHQYVLCFVKGDPRKATVACGPVDVTAALDAYLATDGAVPGLAAPEATPGAADAPPPAPEEEVPW